MEIGHNIKKYRLENNFTQRDLAQKLNVTAQAVSRWENDEVEPDLTTIEKLTEIFGVTADQLINGEEVVRPQETTETIPETPPTEEVGETPKIICSVCGNEIPEHMIFSEDPIVCVSCNKKHQQELKDIKENKIVADCKPDASTKTETAKKERRVKTAGVLSKWSFGDWARLVGSAVVAIAAMVIALIMTPNVGFMSRGAWIATSIILPLLIFSFIYQVFYFDCFVNEVVIDKGLYKTIHLPGIIFSLNVNGIVFYILYKFIIAPIVTFILGVLWFIFMAVVGFVVSPFTFIPAFIRSIKEPEDL